MTQTDVLRCRNISRFYGDVTAVKDVNVSLGKGEIFALVGPSGSGKSTILRMVAGFERPDQGEIDLSGEVISSARVFLPPERRRVGIVFQDYALFPHLTVMENVMFGLRGQSDGKKRASDLIEQVGLRGLEQRYPSQLSGGQQQRVALARSLAPEPKILLLDEPFSNLDPQLRSSVCEDVRALLKEKGITTLFVTHDEHEALFIADRMGIVYEGGLIQVGTPAQVFQKPVSKFVATFLGIADFLPAVHKNGEIETEIGTIVGTAPGIHFDLMVRPDDVMIMDDDISAVPAQVTGKVFQGMHFLYTLTLPSGREVRSLQVHYRSFGIGDTVGVKLVPGHALNCFIGDRAAHHV